MLMHVSCRRNICLSSLTKERGSLSREKTFFPPQEAVYFYLILQLKALDHCHQCFRKQCIKVCVQFISLISERASDITAVLLHRKQKFYIKIFLVLCLANPIFVMSVLLIQSKVSFYRQWICHAAKSVCGS
jgi:hypothetical protein